MPRRSGTDVLFPKWTRPAVFSAGRVLFFGCCFIRPALCRAAVPVCAALSSSACIGRRPRLCRVLVCVVSPFVPCRRSRPVPRRCSGLCCVVILGLHRLPSPFVPCRRSDLRRIVIRCLRRVAVPVCGWRPAVEFRGRSDGDSAPAAGLLRPFPVLRRFRSGRPSAFL